MDGRAAVLLREDSMSRRTRTWLAVSSVLVGLVVGVIGLRRGADHDPMGWVLAIVGFAGVLGGPVIGSQGQDPNGSA